MENGISDGANRKATLTREQFVTMLYRCAELWEMEPDADGDLSGFADADQVSAWAKDAMTWATGCGLITGMDDGTLTPQGNVTRAQMAVILSRFAQLAQ